MVGGDIYTTEEEALARAEELGCSGFHTMENDEGETLYMPCSSHDDYESSTGDSEEVELSANDLVKNPDSHPFNPSGLEGRNEGRQMQEGKEGNGLSHAG